MVEHHHKMVCYYTSLLNSVQWYHFESLKSAMVRIFTPQNLASTTNQGGGGVSWRGGWWTFMSTLLNTIHPKILFSVKSGDDNPPHWWARGLEPFRGSLYLDSTHQTGRSCFCTKQICWCLFICLYTFCYEMSWERLRHHYYLATVVMVIANTLSTF